MELPKERAITEPIDNVFQLFDPERKPTASPSRGTPDEIAEYRRIYPLLIQMLREWEIAKDAKFGCAILASVLAPMPPD